MHPLIRGSKFFFFIYFLTSLAQYFISRLETTQVRSSRAVYDTYESDDALLTMTPTLTPSQNRPHALCASQQPRTRSACIDAHGRDITQHKHRHPLCSTNVVTTWQVVTIGHAHCRFTAFRCSMTAATYGLIYRFSADNLANKISAAYYVYPHLQ